MKHISDPMQWILLWWAWMETGKFSRYILMLNNYIICFIFRCLHFCNVLNAVKIYNLTTTRVLHWFLDILLIKKARYKSPKFYYIIYIYMYVLFYIIVGNWNIFGHTLTDVHVAVALLSHFLFNSFNYMNLVWFFEIISYIVI